MVGLQMVQVIDTVPVVQHHVVVGVTRYLTMMLSEKRVGEREKTEEFSR
jgi:hypothetical protein